jgi:hypothetical protein
LEGSDRSEGSAKRRENVFASQGIHAMSGIKAQHAAKTRAKSLAHLTAAASTKRKMAPVHEIAVKINNSAGSGIELCSASTSTRTVFMVIKLMPLASNHRFGRFYVSCTDPLKAKTAAGSHDGGLDASGSSVSWP